VRNSGLGIPDRPSDCANRLPFIDDNDCGLGIAVRTYLDDLPLQADPLSAEARAEVKSKGKEWFQHSDSFTGNLDMAFKLWDAVSFLLLGQSTEADLVCRSTRGRSMRARSSRTARHLRLRTPGSQTDGEGRIMEIPISPSQATRNAGCLMRMDEFRKNYVLCR
jgi:hypothetical protein